jgi:hypothetical protein
MERLQSSLDIKLRPLLLLRKSSSPMSPAARWDTVKTTTPQNKNIFGSSSNSFTKNFGYINVSDPAVIFRSCLLLMKLYSFLCISNMYIAIFSVTYYIQSIHRIIAVFFFCVFRPVVFFVVFAKWRHMKTFTRQVRCHR